MSLFDNIFGDSIRKIFDDTSSEEEMKVFNYDSLIKIYKREYNRTPGIGSCRIIIKKSSEEYNLISCRDSWRVSIVFCDVANEPLKKPGEDSFYGCVIVCDSIDSKISSIMNGRKEVIFKPGPDELKRMKKRNVFEAIAEKISLVISDAVTVTATVEYIKNFRERTGTKVVVARIDEIRKEAKKSYKEMYVDSIKVLDESNKYVIAEYDENSDEIVKLVIAKADNKVKQFVENNNGIVVIED